MIYLLIRFRIHYGKMKAEIKIKVATTMFNWVLNIPPKKETVNQNYTTNDLD